MRPTPVSAWLALPQPFLSREAHAAGLTSAAIAGGVRRRELLVLAPHLYAVRSAWSDVSPGEAHVALARAGQASVAGSVVSHASAALVHGLPQPWGPLGPVALTVGGADRTAADRDWRRILDGAMPATHVCEVNRVPVTTTARTVADCLRTLRLRDGLAIVDAALASGTVDLVELRRMRVFQRRWPGVRLVEAGLRLADPRRESWLESASVATAVAWHWPVPSSQVAIHHLDGRFIGRVDLLWGELGIVGEADGQTKYLGGYEDEWDAERAARHMVAERDRERQLESVGLAVARWGSVALRSRGQGLDAALRAARSRADPTRVRCLWRQAPDPELYPWRALPPPRSAPHLLPARRRSGRPGAAW